MVEIDTKKENKMIGKHYVVTGGTSGLGLEIVKALLSHGAKVTLIIRDIEVSIIVVK